MSHSYGRQYVAILIWSTALFAISISFASCQQQAATGALGQEKERQLSKQEQEAMNFRVDPGDPSGAGAVKYYAESLEELGLKNWDSLPADPGEALAKLESLQNMALHLDFLGYKDLVPAEFEKNVENLSSAELMTKYPDDLLASAFFAPKITDVFGSDKTNVGWRKVVYLKARKDSRAEAKGIGSGLLLFNKFQGKGNWSEDPIKSRKDKSNESKTTQLILVRADGSSLKYPAYFLVYGLLSAGGKLQAYLTASFDARDPSIGPQGKYFVPNACAQCHGAETGPKTYDLNKVKLNFLDTDHWFDRVQAKDDFAFLQQYNYGVLYDGGNVFDVKVGDSLSSQFKDAFNVIRQINEKIKEQNEKVDGGVAPSFQLRAARKWVTLHIKDGQTDFGHKLVFQRSLDDGAMWSESADPDKDLLPLLNRYCYRCHSSVRFSIFDRSAVVIKKQEGKIRFRLTTPVKTLWMPQDRELDADTKSNLLKLMEALK
jgi:hypothetical protein